jgi:hypothetical protein
MALQDRFQQRNLGDNVISIPTNQFSAALSLWAEGTGTITRQSVIDSFNLDSAEEEGLDKLKTAYESKDSDVSKLAYLIRVKNVLMLLEQGRVTIGQVVTILELT